MVWIESHQSLRDHPKTHKLARTLGISRAQAIGHLHCLWWWAMSYADDGGLDRYDELDLAIGADWDGDPEAFVSALVTVGFLDETPLGLVIHDWEDYAGRLLEQRQQRTQRQARNRSLYNDDELLRAVRERDGSTCQVCGKTVNWRDRKGDDGGTYAYRDPQAEVLNVPENVVVCCRACARHPERPRAQRQITADNGRSTADQRQIADRKSTVNLPPYRTVPNQTEPNHDDPPTPLVRTADCDTERVAPSGARGEHIVVHGGHLVELVNQALGQIGPPLQEIDPDLTPTWLRRSLAEIEAGVGAAAVAGMDLDQLFEVLEVVASRTERAIAKGQAGPPEYQIRNIRRFAETILDEVIGEWIESHGRSGDDGGQGDGRIRSDVGSVESDSRHAVSAAAGGGSAGGLGGNPQLSSGDGRGVESRRAAAPIVT